jgi:solute carrier family 34 (sodium-dependent phosphate cotransporter)
VQAQAVTTLTNETSKQEASPSSWLAWVKVALLVYVLLAAVNTIGDGFKMAVGASAAELFGFASNPIIALIIGVVATALIQSSSTVSSIIVGMVAGGLPLSIAIPMVMGANIGTSLTSTLVSLGHVRNDDEFGRAFSAATVHDSFNLLAVLILLPLELVFKPLERMTAALVSLLPMETSVNVGSVHFMGMLLGPSKDLMKAAVSWMPTVMAGATMIAIGIGLILFVVTAIGRILRKVMVGRALRVMEAAVGRGPVSGIGAGATITVMVQSSSTTTALIVPMAGAGVFSLRQIYPFTLGANIGTTITALLAATAITGPTAAVAMQIAAIHLLFNLFAIAIIFGLPILRSVPLHMAEGLATLARRNRLYVASYIFGVFFVIPLVALGCTQLF